MATTTKVQRGGEVQPDTPNKGSDADRNRHTYGIPEGVPTKGNGPGQPNQEQGEAEKDRQKRGNRGPDEEPGFGQGA